MNKDNQWLHFLETGEDIGLAVKRPIEQRENKKKVKAEYLKKVRAKYGNIRIPMGLPINLISAKQQRGIKLQERGNR